MSSGGGFKWAKKAILELVDNNYQLRDGLIEALYEGLGCGEKLVEDCQQRIRAAADALDWLLSGIFDKKIADERHFGAGTKKFGRERATLALRILGLKPPEVGDSPLTEGGTSSRAFFRVLLEAREAIRKGLADEIIYEVRKG